MAHLLSTERLRRYAAASGLPALMSGIDALVDRAKRMGHGLA